MDRAVDPMDQATDPMDQATDPTDQAAIRRIKQANPVWGTVGVPPLTTQARATRSTGPGRRPAQPAGDEPKREPLREDRTLRLHPTTKFVISSHSNASPAPPVADECVRAMGGVVGGVPPRAGRRQLTTRGSEFASLIRANEHGGGTAPTPPVGVPPLATPSACDAFHRVRAAGPPPAAGDEQRVPPGPGRRPAPSRRRPAPSTSPGRRPRPAAGDQRVPPGPGRRPAPAAGDERRVPPGPGRRPAPAAGDEPKLRAAGALRKDRTLAPPLDQVRYSLFRTRRPRLRLLTSASGRWVGWEGGSRRAQAGDR